MPARPLSKSATIKLLVYADSGWGKTRLAGTSPGKVLFIRPPVEHVDAILSNDKPRCQEWVADDWNEMEEAFEALRLAPAKKFDWVWFDSISGWQDIGLDDLWDTIITENPKRKRYGLDKGDYWINMQRLGRWVRDMVTLSDRGQFNFGITAWPKELDPSPDDPEREQKLMPFVQGKNMAQKTCGYMNMVAFGDFTNRGSRILRFMETGRYYAKDQYDAFIEHEHKLLNPTIPQIVAAVNSKATTRPRRGRATKVKRSNK